jgi:hypothetical protein
MQAPPPVAAQPTGPATQETPADLPRPAQRPTAPILPPLMSPQAPSWKQEARQETPAAEPEKKPAAEPETKPAADQTPETPGENK